MSRNPSIYRNLFLLNAIYALT